MEITDLIWKYLTQNSWPVAIAAFLLGVSYWIITHPESAEKLAKNIRNLSVWLKKKSTRLVRYVVLKIKGIQDQMTINGVISNINKQTHSRIPKMRLHYDLAEENYHSFSTHSTRPNGKVKVVVEDTGNGEQNLLNATSAYLKTAIIANIRPLVENIATAIDLIIIIRVLRKKNKKGLCGNFWGSHFVQNTKNQQVYECVDSFLMMERKGIFSGVLLSEMEHANETPFYQATAAGEVQLLRTELTEFITFTKSISERAVGAPTQLDFERKYIRVGVLLVGGVLTRLYGVRPYVERLTKKMQRGANRVYVIAVGTENVNLTKEIAKHNVEGATMLEDLRVFHPKIFSSRPAIVSLLLVMHGFN